MSFLAPIAASVAGGFISNALSDDGTGQQIVDTTPGAFQELRQPTSTALQDIIGGIQGEGTFDPQSADLSRLFAQISGTAQGLVDRIGGLAGGPTALQQQGRGVLQQTLSGQFTDPASNPFLQSTLDTATRRINEGNQLENAALIGQFKRAGQTLRTDPNRVGSSAFLNQANIAAITSAAVYLPDQKPFDTEMKGGDPSFRMISADCDLDSMQFGHRSEAFDHSGVQNDKNMALPFDRLRELVEEGFIGSINPTNFSFMGSVTAPGRLLKNTAPEVAEKLIDDRVDAVFLTPV